jgi:hypothetical protein
MEIVLTNRARLQAKHGQAAWEQIQAACDLYIDALASVGMTTEMLFLDGLDGDHVQEPKAIKAKLHEFHSREEASYLLILGGDDIVPFYRQSDKTPDRERDKETLSDSFYVDFNEFEHDHWPEMAVGRIPDGADGHLIVRQLRAAAEIHREGGIHLSEKRAGFSTDTWKSSSRITYYRLDPSGATLKLCPPLGLKTNLIVKEVVRAASFPEGGLLYFNMHGHRVKPVWWGEWRVAGFPVTWPELMTQELMNECSLTRSVVLCQACHGASISRGGGLALSALERGTAAFFGSTTTSYAVTLPDGKPSGSSGIDAIFTTLIFNLVKKKMRFGDALCDAKQRHTFHNNYDEKNIFGTVLLGDPLLQFV